MALHLRPGDVVALTGELGAGKTCFVQGAARALGVTERVTSPSFVLRRDYEGRIGVVHLDVYRLDSLREVVELGFDDLFDRHRVTFIEWGDAVRSLLPPDFLEVELRRDGDELDPEVGAPELGGPGPDDTGEEQRRLRVRGHGDGWVPRMAPIAADLSQWRSAAGSPVPEPEGFAANGPGAGDAS